MAISATSPTSGLAPEPATVPASRVAMKPDRLRDLIDQHYDRLWRVVRRFGVAPSAVEDVVQDVLLVVARRLGDVSAGSEWAFAYSTARRVAADHRRGARARPASDGDAPLLGLADPRQVQALARTDDRRLLDLLLDELPDEQREVVVLVELEGMTLGEVARLLGAPQGTIASRLRRARASLEQAVGRMEANELQQENGSIP